MFKQGSGNLREIDRPISTLPIISKSFGKLICEQLSNHFDNTLAKFRSGHRRCSVRKSVLRNFTKFTVKHLYQSLEEVFSCEFREISKNTFFTEHLWATASGIRFQKILFIFNSIAST